MSEVKVMKPAKVKNVKAIVILSVILIIVLATLFSAFAIVPAGHTGVVTRFSAVTGQVMSEGLNFKIPFVTKVISIDNRVLKAEVESKSASKDLQTVTSTISLNYRVDKGSSADIYQNIGLDYENVIVIPAILESVKAVTAKYTAEELITKRQAISELMCEALAEKINPHGLSIEVFNIINFDFSEEFNAAIEAKQTAQQNALKAEQDLVRIKVEAEQEIEKAKAEAEAYKLKSTELTQQMLAMEWISKWDGKLPTVAGSGEYILDLQQFLDSAKKAE